MKALTVFPTPDFSLSLALLPPYTLSPTGKYHFRGGYNPVAIAATAVGAVLAMLLVLLGSSDVAAFSWFLGAGAAFLIHWGLSRRAHTPAHAKA